MSEQTTTTRRCADCGLPFSDGGPATMLCEQCACWADDEEDYGDGLERNCQTCSGGGWEWCEDVNSSEGCWVQGCDGRAHTCPNCKGSGLAKDQWYW